jgi:hypothetical protein
MVYKHVETTWEVNPEDAPGDAAAWAVEVLRDLARMGLDAPADPPWLSDTVWNRLRRLVAGEAPAREIEEALQAAAAEHEAQQQWSREYEKQEAERRRRGAQEAAKMRRRLQQRMVVDRGAATPRSTA